MSIERDKNFEQLEDIAAMMTENSGIEFENGKYVYYGLDTRTAFAAVYISGAWSGWQAKAQSVPENKQFNLDEFLTMEEKLKHKGGVITADLDRFIAYAEMVLEKAKTQAVPEGFALVPKEPTSEVLKAISAEIIKPNNGRIFLAKVYKAMIEAQEPK